MRSTKTINDRWLEFRQVILITGTPGVGKTVVSSLLASKLDALHIDIAELVKEENLVRGFDKTRETLIADAHKTSNRVKEIIHRSERDVIVDGHYAVDVVAASKIYRVFVLRRNPDELKKILKDYGFEGRKLWENLAAEILDVCLWNAVSACGSDKVCEIDVSGRKIGEITEGIIQILEESGKCETGVVDWLGKLEKERRLQDFLKHF